jgi:hypothetical protein
MHFVSAQELSKILSINYFTIMNYAERGWIPSIKINRLRRFNPDEVIAWFKDGRFEHAKMKSSERMEAQ